MYANIEDRKANSRKHYQDNKEKYMERNRLARQRNQQYVLSYLAENPCVDCGMTDARCLQFDHRDVELKTANVSKLIQAAVSIKKIQAEIDKCDVRCANCHSIRTCIQFGWYKNESN